MNVAPADYCVRQKKMTLDRNHSAKTSHDPQTVELEDGLYILSDADEYELEWTRRCTREKMLLIEVLNDVNSQLWTRAKEQIDLPLTQDRYKQLLFFAQLPRICWRDNYLRAAEINGNCGSRRCNESESQMWNSGKNGSTFD